MSDGSELLAGALAERHRIVERMRKEAETIEAKTRTSGLTTIEWDSCWFGAKALRAFADRLEKGE